MRQWDREQMLNCADTKDRFSDIVFVASDKNSWAPNTTQEPFVDNGSVRFDGNEAVPVSVCSQYVWWLSTQFNPIRKTVDDIDIWETPTRRLFFFYLPDKPNAYPPAEALAVSGASAEASAGASAEASAEASAVADELEDLALDCKNANLKVEEMHEGDPFDLENARRMMVRVQKRVDHLAASCEHIENLHVEGPFGDALMILSPFGEMPNVSADTLLKKTDQVVFHPSFKTPYHIEEWHCGKIDKFLADNTSPRKKLAICFDDLRFDLTPSRIKRDPWDRVGKQDDNGFKLDHRDRVTVRRPHFIVQVDGGKKQQDVSHEVDAAQVLKNFGRVVP